MIMMKCVICKKEARFPCRDDAIDAGWNRAIVGGTVLDFCPEHSEPDLIVETIRKTLSISGGDASG